MLSRRIAAFAVALLLAGCVPKSDYRIPDSGPPVPLSAVSDDE